MSIERGAAVFRCYIYRWVWIPNALCLAVARSYYCPTSDRLDELQGTLPRFVIIRGLHVLYAMELA